MKWRRREKQNSFGCKNFRHFNAFLLLSYFVFFDFFFLLIGQWSIRRKNNESVIVLSNSRFATFWTYSIFQMRTEHLAKNNKRHLNSVNFVFFSFHLIQMFSHCQCVPEFIVSELRKSWRILNEFVILT